MKTALIYTGGVIVIWLVLLSIYFMLKKLIKDWHETEKAGHDPHEFFNH